MPLSWFHARENSIQNSQVSKHASKYPYALFAIPLVILHLRKQCTQNGKLRKHGRNSLTVSAPHVLHWPLAQQPALPVPALISTPGAAALPPPPPQSFSSSSHPCPDLHATNNKDLISRDLMCVRDSL